MKTFDSPDALEAEVGNEVTVSDWLVITQDRVNQFAEATDDPQWIHVDVERAKKESPFGGTVAHGFLTLSLLPRFFEAEVAFPFARMSINYGTNKVRFPSPLRVGRRIRGRFSGTAERPRVSGYLSPEQIMRVVRQNSAAIRYCYESELQRQPNLRGRAFVMGLQEARRTKAPLIPGLQSGKAVFRPWG